MLRFGLVGAGSIARKFAEDIKVVENAELVAVASRSLERAKEFQNEFQIQYAFGSYQELAESDKIDAVYIATPHNFHMEQTILFLNNDKHVLCEKPIAVNKNQLQKMISVAHRRKLLFMEAMWAVYLPANQYVKKLIDSKQYGEIKTMSLSFGFDLGDKESLKDKRHLNINLAGGSLLDVGVYNVALSNYFNPCKIIKMDSDASFYETGVDLSVVTNLEYENGVKAIWNSSIKEDLKSDAIIEFESGTVKIPNFWCATEVIDNGKIIPFPHKSQGFEYEIESFTKSFYMGQTQNETMTHSVSQTVMSILDDIRNDIGLVYPNE